MKQTKEQKIEKAQWFVQAYSQCIQCSPEMKDWLKYWQRRLKQAIESK